IAPGRKAIEIHFEAGFDYRLKEKSSKDNDTNDLTFTCSQCNKEEVTSNAIEHNGNKYCSAKCRDDATQQKPPQKECPQCHKKFANLPISGSQGKSYCSDKCKQAAEKDKDKDKDKEKYNPQDDIDKAEQARQAQLAQNKQALRELIEKAKGQESVSDLKTTLDQIEQKN